MPSTATGTLARTSTTPLPRFTPGPWYEHSHRQIGPDAGIVCEVWSAIGSNDADAINQADANCRLIEAAPDLHQVCVAAEALLTRQRFNADEHSPEGTILAMLRATLAKVGGAA